MDREIHPAETALFVAAALRGLRLEETQDGRLYRVVNGKGAAARTVTTSGPGAVALKRSR
jgi:hypothetical protein